MRLQTLQDWPQAAALIAESWKENHEQALDYTPDFIESLAGYPASLPVIAPAFFDGDQLAAFVMGFPRNFEVEGLTRKLLLMTLFTVGPRYKGQGLGRRIWAECLRQACDAGYEGALYYCVEGNISNKVTAAGVQLAGFEALHILTIPYLMRMLRRPLDAPADSIGPDSEMFLKCAAAVPPLPLRRCWTESEFTWQLQRPGAIAVSDGKTGVLCGYTLNSSDAQRTSVFFVEDVLWLQDAEDGRTRLLALLLQQASRVSSLAVVPVLGYAALKTFVAAGFRKSPRVLNAYLVNFPIFQCSSPITAIYAEIL